MTPLGKTMEHVRLVSRMAKAGQTDLVGAAEAGELSQPQWANIVEVCRRCPCVETCQNWLDKPDTENDIPKWCSNRDRFLALRDTARTRQTDPC